jgi:ribosomal protein L22
MTDKDAAPEQPETDADALEAKAPEAAAESAAPPAAVEAGEEQGAAPKRRRMRRGAKAEQGGEGEAAPAKASAGAKAPKARASKAPAEPAVKPAAPPSRAAKRGAASRRRVVRARARYVRTPARKARIVCVHLPGKSVAQARAILAFTPREVARDWSKLLESAVANAENNHELLEDDLIIREAYADEGPTIKRFRPRAMGRATPIRKRTSHLTITLAARPD